MKIYLYRNASGKLGWRMVARNGQIVATDSHQGYNTKAGLRRSLHRNIMFLWNWNKAGQFWFDGAGHPDHRETVPLIDLTV